MAAMNGDRTIGKPGTGSSRRGVLRMFGGAAAAGVVAALPATGSAATKKRKPAADARNGGSSRKANRNGAGTRRAGATTVTRTFTNPDFIPIIDQSSATPYPSPILVSGFANATLTDVNLTLNGLSHIHQQDVDILLAAPDGRNALVLSDVGGENDATRFTIQLDDQARSNVPTPLTSGTFRPTTFDDGSDSFPSPAPPLSGNVALSVFQGIDPNGEWQLFIRDDAFGDAGYVFGGWQLEITATMPPPKKKKKHKKKR